ncbi:MAG: hypothetical protein K0S92_2006 [Desertimonas sp.]|nr:hypothetical protein [Desertimonas sp.]
MSSVTGQAHGIGAAVHGDDSLGGGCRRGVHRRGVGVGVGAADDGEVQCPGEVEIGGETGFAGEQGRVLSAQQALADDGVRTSFGDRHRLAPAAASTALTMLW